VENPQALWSGILFDLGEHFFTRTRWERTFKLVRGVSDSELSAEPLPINAGSPDP